MSPFSLHVDEGALARLDGPRLSRALRHARRCPRCAPRVERTLQALRTLEGGSPWAPTEAEAAAHLEAGLPAALGAAGTPAMPHRALWAGTAVLLAGAAVAALTLVVRVPRPDEFAARGGGDGRAVLRTFCAPSAQPGGGQPGLRELAAGGTCPVGATLAFAAAADDLPVVVVRLSGPEGDTLLGPFGVTARPGAEAPLDATPALHAPGPLTVTASFGRTADDARAALGGALRAGAVVRTQTIQVEARP